MELNTGDRIWVLHYVFSLRSLFLMSVSISRNARSHIRKRSFPLTGTDVSINGNGRFYT